MPETCDPEVDNDLICQQFWNRGFLNGDSDPLAQDTYEAQCALTPNTFSGPPLATAIPVNVLDD